jgi:hypothetical protein
VVSFGGLENAMRKGAGARWVQEHDPDARQTPDLIVLLVETGGLAVGLKRANA